MIYYHKLKDALKALELYGGTLWYDEGMNAYYIVR